MRTLAPDLEITWYRLLSSLVNALLALWLTVPALYSTTSLAYKLPDFNETPTNVTFYKGDRAILRCSVNSLGTKQVIWMKANGEHPLTVGKMVYPNDPDIDIDHLPLMGEWNLIIKNVKPKHAGLYECQISTKEDLKRFIQLNVIDGPSPRHEGIKISGKDFVEKGEKIVLTCNATGVKQTPDDIDWFMDGTKIKENQKEGITIVKFRVAETKTLHSKLIIEHSSMQDSGVYICRSSDLAITSKSVMVLNGKNGPPIITRSKDDKYMRVSTTDKGSVVRKKKKLINGEKSLDGNAEKSPNRRDHPDPSEARGAAARNVSSISKLLLTCLLCVLTFHLHRT